MNITNDVPTISVVSAKLTAVNSDQLHREELSRALLHSSYLRIADSAQDLHCYLLYARREWEVETSFLTGWHLLALKTLGQLSFRIHATD